MSTRIAVVVLCVVTTAALGLAQGRPHGSEIATFNTLPSLGGDAQALAVDEAGTTIAGAAQDRSGLWHAVKWTLQANGSWAITDLPWPPGATRTIARGVSNLGDVVGHDGDGFPATNSRPLLWPETGGFELLSCDTTRGAAYAISASAQVVVGFARTPAFTAAIWRPGCVREDLPTLINGGSGIAYAVNGDGTIVGGNTSSANYSVPARWVDLGGQWQVGPLDNRNGTVYGANTIGDLAGVVVVPCALQNGCQRAVIWYARGGFSELSTLGGEHSVARDINGSGEVVGISTSRRGGSMAYFWSPSTGMVQLPLKGRWAAANALSDVGPDGTRLVVGMNSQGEAVVWVVRNP